MKFQTIISNKDYDKLYYLLKDQNLSEAYISRLRREKGLMLVNGENATMKTSLNIGDKIEIAEELSKKSSFKHCDLPLEIVFEDDYLLIINKPSNLTCIPNKSHYDLNLAGAVCKYMDKKCENFVYRIINRLDKDTSGLVVIAKNLFAYNNISQIEKTYEAICEGKIDKEIIINKPIYTENINGINTMKRIISPLGKEAQTHVYPIKSSTELSHIKLKIKHGRTHQIRVHLSSVAHPLLGDIIYGKKSNLINHTALICKEISFIHPKTKEKICLSAKYEDDFQKLIEQISI